MSEANLKKALRNVINAHIRHTTSNGPVTNYSIKRATAAQYTTFQNVLKRRIAGLVTSEMRVRHLLNTKYVTNLNKNQIVTQLKNTNITNQVKFNQALKNKGYALSPSANQKQRISKKGLWARITK
jgi:hypothetical protein